VSTTLLENAGPLAHLAIFQEPYLEYVMQGTKTIESRFGRNLVAPHGIVKTGDLLLLKRVSGPIVGLARIGFVHSYALDEATWREIRKRFSRALCAHDAEFWAKRRYARFATLMQITHRATIDPVTVAKQDRRGWVVLQKITAVHEEQMSLLGIAKRTLASATTPASPASVPGRPHPAALSASLQLSLPGIAYG
jgi:hypothetical protein